MEILVEPRELDLVSPDPDAEAEPATRQDVETGSLFGDEYGLTLRQDQYLGREVSNLCATSEETEQHERVVIEIGRSGGGWVQPGRLATLAPSTWSGAAIP
jgi:hypothetical protein